ncbi:MAG: AmmeMemoRadiSam system radical SAM enzyme [Pseudomonadota bacterium]
MKRREFLQSTAAGAAAAAAVLAVPCLAAGAGEHKPVLAKYWKALENEEIQCRLCPHECQVGEGSRGMCGVRENIGGKYYTLVHSRPVALHNDPVEKKPFFHFIPGTMSYSMATAGCNFSCTFCQNWEISQFKPEEVPSMFLSPKDVVETALKKGSKSIAFTYNEPTVFYEYMYETAKLAKENGLQTGVISNGFIQKKPLEALLDYIDAYRVDFKSFKEKFYTDISSGHLKPVLKTMKRIKRRADGSS